MHTTATIWRWAFLAYCHACACDIYLSVRKVLVQVSRWASTNLKVLTERLPGRLCDAATESGLLALQHTVPKCIQNTDISYRCITERGLLRKHYKQNIALAERERLTFCENHQQHASCC